MLKTGTFLAAALFLSSCAPPPAPDAEAPAAIDASTARMAVDTLRAAYKAAVESGDAAATAALYAEDGVLLPASGGRYAGRQAIQGSYQATFARGAFTFSAEPNSFEIIGDAAVEEGSVSYSVTPENGTAVSVEAEYLVVSKQVDGEWKIVRLMSKPTVQPAM